MLPLDHPFFFLEQLFGRKRTTFHFSRYVYVPDSLSDERELVTVRGEDISLTWFEDQLASLRMDQELALHSPVIVDKRTLHIPMIDFYSTQLGQVEIDRFRTFVPRNIFSNSAFFRTGRSFHAYSKTLLTPKAWLEFMGRLLLVNPSRGAPIVDTRWIGHRLIAGYCALRVSNNSDKYLAMPAQVGVAALLSGRPS